MNRLYVGSLLCLLLPLAGLNAAEDAGSRGIVETLETAASVAKVVGPPVVSGVKAVGGAVIGHRSKTKRIESLEASSEVHTKDIAALKNIMETGALHQEESVKKQIKKVSDSIPTAKHPKGFARQEAVDALKLQVDSYKDDPKDPLVGDPEHLGALENKAIEYVDAQMIGVVRQQQLDVRMAGVVKDDVNNPVVRSNQMVGVVKEEPNNLVVRQDQIKDVITMQHVQVALKYFAKQSALGGAAYCSSPVIESLLQSAGMENEYIELKTISVPTTTFLISLGARCATKIYDDKLVLLPEVAKEAAYDAGTSAAVMGLKSFFCDDQMCKEINEKMSEKNRTAVYAGTYGALCLIRALLGL